jgi:hypothetical protein
MRSGVLLEPPKNGLTKLRDALSATRGPAANELGNITETSPAFISFAPAGAGLKPGYEQPIWIR